ncbi:hypothetical protein C7271_15975 [filamentous cyanobacterium CCP5]|nr:hypothetical protein C7271_15975 [filamentous cyanobacterium CCP5]
MQTYSSGRGLAIATLSAVIVALLINTLSNFFPLGGQNVGEIANTVLDGVLIIPANYAFAIWGLIYVGLIAYGVYQLRPVQRDNPNLRRVSGLLIIASGAQIVWILCFTLQLFALSILPMGVILLARVGPYLNLGTGEPRPSRKRRWLAQIPFSVYLAWISVATIINVASALYTAGWQGWGISDGGWTAIMVGIAMVLAGVVAWRSRDIAFVLVYVWAFGAIAARHGDRPLIWVTAVVAIVINLAVLAVSRWRYAQAKR